LEVMELIERNQMTPQEKKMVRRFMAAAQRLVEASRGAVKAEATLVRREAEYTAASQAILAALDATEDQSAK
jgi:hypothetical protein